jgi:hypothetical protein
MPFRYPMKSPPPSANKLKPNSNKPMPPHDKPALDKTTMVGTNPKDPSGRSLAIKMWDSPNNMDSIL